MENKRYTECYIAFLDILGFKRMIEKKDPKEILSIFEKIEDIYTKIHDDEGEKYISTGTISALKIKVMSDSICFYIDASKPNALLTVLISCLVLQVCLLDLPDPILIRGSIIRGELYAKEDILFGPGLTRAYLMEEHNAKYPRIIITNDVLDYVRRENILNKKILVGIDTRLTFRDFDAFRTLDFAAGLIFFSEQLNGKRNDKKVYNRFKEKVSNVLDSTIDESIREKYLYLENVLKRCDSMNGDFNA